MHILSFKFERTNVSSLVYSCVCSNTGKLICTQKISIAAGALEKAKQLHPWIYRVHSELYIVEHGTLEGIEISEISAPAGYPASFPLPSFIIIFLDGFIDLHEPSFVLRQCRF